MVAFDRIARMHVVEFREGLGWSKAELARVSGVPASTIGRIERGEVDPQWGTLQRLFRAMGTSPEQVGADAGGYVPVAAGVARALLDPGYQEVAPLDEEREFWERHFSARGLLVDGRVVDPRGLALAAGRHLRVSVGLVFRLPVSVDWSLLRVLDQVEASRSAWCVTGAFAAQWLGVTGAVKPAQVVVRAEHPTRVAASMERVAAERVSGSIAVLPFDSYTEVGSVMSGEGVWWADPLQVLMDCAGGDEADRAHARALADLWDADVVEAREVEAR